ncbi:MAG: hypothetical protein Kow00104_04970 [Rhodothalassiaceae bacterium]
MPDKIDVHVAKRISALRVMKGRSRAWLAAAMGISTQRIAKYETCRSMMHSSLLWRAACCLRVSVESLFDGAEHLKTGFSEPRGPKFAPELEDFLSDHTGELIRLFESISSPRRRRALVRLFEAVAESSLPEDAPTDQ